MTDSHDRFSSTRWIFQTPGAQYGSKKRNVPQIMTNERRKSLRYLRKKSTDESSEPSEERLEAHSRRGLGADFGRNQRRATTNQTIARMNRPRITRIRADKREAERWGAEK